MAKLYFRYSAMGAGKSLDLLKVAFNYEQRGQNVALFTTNKDDRFGEGVIASRIGIKKEAILFDDNTDIFNEVIHLENKNKKINCVLIDECQFLNKEQVLNLTFIVDKLEIPVICYGIRTDFKGELFEGSASLFALADNIEEIKTICHCGRKAIMNARIKNGKIIKDGEQVEIGDSSYVSLCREHYNSGILDPKKTSYDEED